MGSNDFDPSALELDPSALEEGTCGHELARDAEVPDLLAQLMVHVAVNMDRHAAWVSASSEAGRPEAEGLRQVAELYRSMAREAEKAATTMRGLRDVPASPHDPRLLDHGAFVRRMETKVGLQLRLAKMLSEHAASSKLVLKKLESQPSAEDVGRTSGSSER